MMWKPGMRKPRGWLTVGLAFAALLGAMQANALGLGSIHVQSGLGQPFSALIPLRLASPSDLDGLTVGLADAAAFRRAGVVATNAVSTLHFKVEKTGSGAEIQVTGKRPVREPFLNFLVSVQWNGGTLLREYTVLLNPPDYGSTPVLAGASTLASSQPGSAPVAIPEHSGPATAAAVAHNRAPRPVPAQTQPSPPIPTPRVAGHTAAVAPGGQARPAHEAPPAATTHAAPHGGPAAGAGQAARSYGPVKAGQTFWSIAEDVRPDASVTMDQVLLSIYTANPKAFSDGRFDGLMKGRTLHIPSEAQMRSVSVSRAAARVTALRAKVRPRSAAKHPQTTKRAQAPATAAAPHAGAGTAARPVQGESSGTATEGSPQTPAGGTSAVATQTATSAGGASGGNSAGETTAGSNTLESRIAAAQHASATLAATTSAPPAANASTHVAAASTVSSVATVAPAGAAAAVAGSGKPAEVRHPAGAEGPKTQPHAVPPAARKAPQAVSSSAGTAGGGINWRLVVIAVLVLFVLFALVLRKRRKTSPDGAEESFPAGTEGPEADSDAAADGAAASGSGKAVTHTIEAAATGVATAAATDAASADDETLRETELGVDGLPAEPEEDDGSSRSLAETLGAADDFGTVQPATAAAAVDVEDPLADAEFHLAYGLYDEAIPLLKQAIALHPERDELQLRLAEAYFSAGKAVEYETLAGALKERVSDAEWRQLAANGRQLSPGAALFEGVPPPEDEIGDELQTPDWALPSEPTTAADDQSPAVGAEPVDDVATDAAAPGDHVIDFEPSEPDAPTPGRSDGAPPPVSADQLPAGQVSPPESFDLGNFDAIPLEPESRVTVPEDIDVDDRLDLGPLNFDLGEADPAQEAADSAPAEPMSLGGDLAQPSGETVGQGADATAQAADRVSTASGPTPAAGPDAAAPSVAKESGASAPEDYSGKLELAEIYASMGDNDAAREMIDAVLKGGTAEQKEAAEELGRTLAN